MGSVSKLATAEAVGRVAIAHAIEHPRAKALSANPRVSPLRREGRAVAATLLHRTLADDEIETQHRVARVLGVSHTLVQKWTDPTDKRQFPVGDLVALAIAGSTTVVYAYLDELARFLIARSRARRSPLEHAVQIVVATGRASTALTADSTNRGERVRALRAVKFAADEALADLDPSEVP